MIYRKTLSLLVAFVICGANATSAQSRADQIRSEVYIMENILDQLLQASIDNWFKGKTKGVYLEDYGLLFTVNLERNFFSPAIFDIFTKEPYDTKTRAETERSNHKKPALIYSIRGQEDSAQFEQRVEKLSKKIQTFLGAYVDRNNRLLPNEQIGVYAFFENSWDRRPQGRFFQLRKKTIQDFRDDRISEEQFSNKISQHNVDDESDREEIKIMGTVIKSTLGGKRAFGLHSAVGVRGVYIKDLGVMFTLGDLSLYDKLMFDAWEFVAPPAAGKFDPKTFVDSEKKRRMERTEKFKDKLMDYKRKIVQCVGNYGPTLRFLPENQSVFVLVRVEGGFGESTPANVMIRIKKADIMQYSQRKLDSDGLLQRAHVVEY